MKAVILAAGKGERLEPLTDYLPKALLPIGNKPIIEHQIEVLRRLGADEIAVVVGYLKEKIVEKLGSDVKYFEDRLIKGTATALLAAKNFIDDNFILLYGDVFFDANLSKIIGSAPSMAIYKVKDVSRYGSVEFSEGKLRRISEKTSSGEGYVNAGIYYLPPEIVDIAEDIQESPREEYELTDAIMKLNERKPVRVVPIEGYWNDIGYPWDYLDANMYYLEKVKCIIIETAEIWPQAIIRKPVIIGDNTTVKNAMIERSVIGNNCTIGEFSAVKRSVIMNNSNAPHFNYVADSIIGENVNLGAGTKIANLRFDEKPVKVTIKGERVSSGRRKLGAIIGHNVKTGINVSIYPGVKIGSDSWIESEILVKRDVKRKTFLRKSTYNK